MLNVLFLCTGNSCRSQMAEGWARRLKGDSIEPYSAGIETPRLEPEPFRSWPRRAWTFPASVQARWTNCGVWRSTTW